ncbi:YbjN domain-containing protein [Pseudonocardia endophytica]|uniref:Putative sensory transduction regulator n=1 Tax=Pseudonocardia endophytica TaxID=401976 RepID=A0A4R1HDN5_PSEEN|nr:YbjN domain-containing protein [Pseudonocardia endophytica]TCK20154.1 putative sensory transduction regulator [Pseudonocardia endophytica]
MTELDRLVLDALREMEVDHVHRGDGQFIVTLPGTARLQTHCWLLIRDQTMGVQAFVCRRPDENHEGVYRFMLQRNAKLYGVHYAIDRVGDIHLVGRVPRHAITPDEIDTVLGSVLEAADGDFNTFLELGFANSIRREYAWRTENGESTANLKAFEHLFA